MNKKLLTLIIVLLVVASFIAGRFSVKQVNNENNEETKTEVVDSGNLSQESYKLLFNLLDYENETIYVIGHKNPDTDTVTSAITMAHLLQKLGIKAEPRIAGELNKETQYIFDTFEMEIPPILDNAAGKQIWLVDHSAPGQAIDGMEDARIVGIVDHHGVGELGNEEQIFVRSGKYGSTTGIVYTLFKECGIEVSKEDARLMLCGLLSDTSNFAHDDNVLNREIYDELIELADIEDLKAVYDGMVRGKLDLSGYTETEIYYHDYKDNEENGIWFGVGNIKVATKEDIKDMANRMDKVVKEEIKTSKCEYLFYHVYDFYYEEGYLGCVAKDQSKVPALLKSAFGDKYEVYDDYVIMKPSVSRKEVLIPRLNDAFNKMK